MTVPMPPEPAQSTSWSSVLRVTLAPRTIFSSETEASRPGWHHGWTIVTPLSANRLPAPL